jgi:Berberine and berberine like
MKLPDIPVIPEAIRGQHVAHLRILYVGAAEEATRLVDDLRAAAPIAQDTVTEMSYGDAGTIHSEPEGSVVFEASNTLLAALDDEAVDTLLAHVGPEGEDAYLVELRHLGGRLASQDGRRGSTGRRDGLFTLYAGTALEGEDRTVAAEAQGRLHQAMAPWAAGGVCASFLSGPAVTLDDYRSGFDEEDFGRLQELKSRFDPNNMFRINYNIPPVQA